MNGNICVICSEPINQACSLLSPCCEKTWAHHKCLEILQTTENNVFKCPACIIKKEPYEGEATFKIVHPDRDEKSGSLRGSVKVEVGCSAKECLCDEGRAKNRSGTQWEVIVCDVCTSVGTHRRCSDVQLITNQWQCQTCHHITVKIEDSIDGSCGNFKDSASEIYSYHPPKVCKTKITEDVASSTSHETWKSGAIKTNLSKSILPRILDKKTKYLDVKGKSESSYLKAHCYTPTNEKHYKCDYDGCDAAFSHKSNLKRHRRIHTNENPFKYDDLQKPSTVYESSKMCLTKLPSKVTKMAPALSKLSICAAAILILSDIEKRPLKRKRRIWESSFLKGRNYEKLLNDLKADETGLCKNFNRMSSLDFEYLLNKIEEKVSRSDTNFRDSIPASVRLALTLQFLATGDSYTSLMHLFRISKASISRIIPEVCKAIVESLKEHLKKPENEDEWLRISQGFEQKWDFPRVIGAIDGKHVVVQCPPNNNSEHFNSKSFFSILLFALVDADYNFIFVDVGCQGRISDGAIFKNSQIYKDIENNRLNLPQPSKLVNGHHPVPYVILGDNCFGLSNNLMKPYSGFHLKGTPERIFNNKVIRTRRVVENAFGILSSVFRVLRKPLLLDPKKAMWIVKACLCLHNFLRQSTSSSYLYCPPGAIDTEENGEFIAGAWRAETEMTSLLALKKVSRKPSTNAEEIREAFSDYFIRNPSPT